MFKIKYTDLIRTHGNSQEKVHVHLKSRIRYAHGQDTHSWKRALTLNPGFNQANVGYARPLWILLGHYGSAVLGCGLPVIWHRPAWP